MSTSTEHQIGSGYRDGRFGCRVGALRELELDLDFPAFNQRGFPDVDRDALVSHYLSQQFSGSTLRQVSW